MAKLTQPQAKGAAIRESLLTTAVVQGYAGKVSKSAEKMQMGPAILAMVGVGDAECDRLRQEMVATGETTPERCEMLHRKQKAWGMHPHNAVLWPVSMLLERGPHILPPAEMEVVRTRLQDPRWQIILALASGGATALCLPVEVVDHCADLAADPGRDLIEADDEDANG
jgi:hypothetical protein